ncbi:asparagine synthase (glutamine-hydrolyzing) [Alteribacillus sp. HJP-4]|uniref:asparagine synthase (glutamine-hydrolyzing) n=1 Tax=Alteribacillus sp. HJP-4 TaxID=2775394 RepID=UPI0035CCE43D
MCGFVACIHDHPVEYDGKDYIEKMNVQIKHRGPDQEGYFTSDHVQMGFRRLSIIDFENGQQPLSYENGRYWIVFNGEIYNYIELRKELKEKGLHFETESDTEVLLALYAEEGAEAVKRLRGMFAFVIWDKERKHAFAARDHFGIKPLFYKEEAGKIFFASEKKSLLMLDISQPVNLQALHHYMSFQYVPEPYSMTMGIQKIEPGNCVYKNIGDQSFSESYFRPVFQPSESNEKSWIHQIKEVMSDSVEKHLRSDASVGAFLSGGIDSTIIAALAKEVKPDLETFSVGFQHEGYSELDIAEETADKLDIKNYSKIISAGDYAEALPKIMWHMDDPLADPACVPLYFVAEEARKRVKVVLSGEGADELFGGYNIYREPQSLSMFQYMPLALKQLLNRISRIIPDGIKGKSFIERGTTSLEERYIGNANIFSEKEKKLVLTNYLANYPNDLITKHLFADTKEQHSVNRMQHLDICSWLRGDILVKADRMTMAHSLELRVPFLDKEVFQAASQIDPALKTAQGTTKYILRKAFQGIVPDHVYMRKKLGFPVPLRHWLKNELYDWAIHLIKTSQTDQYVNKSYAAILLDDHCLNKGDNSRKLWTILSFMVWHQVYIENVYDSEQWIKEQPLKAHLIG